MRADMDRFEELAQVLGCDNPVRQAMEANMVAYFEGRSPTFRSGL